jgi:hypothetical protein
MSLNRTGLVTPPHMRLLQSKNVPDVSVKFSAGTMMANRCPQDVIPHPSIIKFNMYANKEEIGCRNQYEIAFMEKVGI